MTELESLLWRSADRVEPGAGSRWCALSTCCTSLIHSDLTLWYITDRPCTCNQGFRTCGSHVLATRYSLLSNFIFARPSSLYCEEYVYIHISDCAGIAYELELLPEAYNLTTFVCRLSWNLGASSSWNTQGLSRPIMELLYPNNTASETFLHRLGAGRNFDLAVAGRTRDIWQNVLNLSQWPT